MKVTLSKKTCDELNSKYINASPDHLKVFDYNCYIYYDSDNDNYYLHIKDANNDIMFKDCEIQNPTKFCEAILGYKAEGNFPQLNSIEDVVKILKILDFRYTYKKDGPLYPVGTKVVIAKREGDSSDYIASFTDEMTAYTGHVYTIERAAHKGLAEYEYGCKLDDGYNYYLIGDDVCQYMWRSSMLEPYKESDNFAQSDYKISFRASSKKPYRLKFQV